MQNQLNIDIWTAVFHVIQWDCLADLICLTLVCKAWKVLVEDLWSVYAQIQIVYSSDTLRNNIFLPTYRNETLNTLVELAGHCALQIKIVLACG